VIAGVVGAEGDPGFPNTETPEAPLQPAIATTNTAKKQVAMPNGDLMRFPGHSFAKPFNGWFLSSSYLCLHQSAKKSTGVSFVTIADKPAVSKMYIADAKPLWRVRHQ
jgi:hypothetical protein